MIVIIAPESKQIKKLAIKTWAAWGNAPRNEPDSGLIVAGPLEGFSYEVRSTEDDEDEPVSADLRLLFPDKRDFIASSYDDKMAAMWGFDTLDALFDWLTGLLGSYLEVLRS